ncbi:MAG: hypothetical protein LPK00_03100 [Bacillaceae bacterium]|nr:hypothetical protein [Bacillaceae bacterium]
MNDNCWKLNNEYYALYVESKDVMRRINRYYKDFELMATYFDHNNGKVIAKQFRVPIHRKRSAFRLSKIA